MRIEQEEDSVPALANALAWLGSGAGALAFGWVAERFGVRRTALFGAVMIGAGLALASQGGTWELLIGHGVLIGLLGEGATNVPLIIYSRRRSLLAGPYIWFFANICGMALGGWFAGAMYDQLGSYAPAFVAGVGFNLGNIALIGWLATRIR